MRIVDTAAACLTRTVDTAAGFPTRNVDTVADVLTRTVDTAAAFPTRTVGTFVVCLTRTVVTAAASCLTRTGAAAACLTRADTAAACLRRTAYTAICSQTRTCIRRAQVGVVVNVVLFRERAQRPAHRHRAASHLDTPLDRLGKVSSLLFGCAVGMLRNEEYPPGQEQDL